MSPTTCTHGVPISVRCDIMHDVVGAACANSRWNIVQIQGVANLPGDDVVRDRGIPAHSDRSHQNSAGVVEGQTTPKDVHSAGFFSNHRVIVLTIVGGLASVGDGGIHRIAVLQSVEGSAGLNSRVNIGCRERQSGKAERIGGIRLLGRNDPAARPLITAMGS